MNFNIMLAARIYVVGLMTLLCLFGGCTNDTEKNNIKLRQRIEDFTGTVASLRSENADLQVSIDRTAKSMTDHKNENIELHKQIKELKWAVAVLTKETTLLRKRLDIDNPSSTRKPDQVDQILLKVVAEQKKEQSRRGTAQREAARRAKSNSDLELLSWGWSSEHGYVTAEGQVKNISSQNLQNVMVVATFYDAQGQFITSGSAIIEYNPILPGQTSPFKAMKTYNPAMKKTTIEFKYLSGGTISTYHKK